MKKILFIITSTALVAGLLFSFAGKEQPNSIVKHDSERLVAKMVGPGGGMG
ncbi:hypothetical protein ACQKNO_24500 [Bacillus paramycoides]|uniref:hypothetical protein n=1 Tax=Bacillus paramycoides TaxID=2026194 RepID=UPI003D011E61